MEKELSPVAVFVYNRPGNTREVIEALQKNYLAPETDVIVFSDGPKNSRAEKAVAAVRAYLKTVTGFKSFTVVERPENFYIERNIIDGVTNTVNKFGRVIVLEDDGVTSPYFLTFMNQALDFYDSHKRVMHIGTFTFIDWPERKTFLWRYAENTGGGWATWKDRWDKFTWFQSEAEALTALTPEKINYIELDGIFKCLGNLKHPIIPWDICWNIAIVRNDGLTVNSPGALTKNNGLYNGTHFTALNRILGKSQFTVELDQSEDIAMESVIAENSEAVKKLKQFYTTLGNRWRDKIWHYFVRMLVLVGITKVLKKLFR
ncbi:MAG: glycosyltransferase [Candidatus Paceibacterota bacterium]